MKKLIAIATTVILMLVLLLLALKRVYERQPDPQLFFSGEVKWLGNPLAERWPAGEKIYARNIWDLQRYQDKIYIGSGNSANSGPIPNAGPIDIWYYHPQTDKFVREGEVNDEQIDHYKIINKQLFIPGHDAAAPDNWDFGNYYQKTPENWVKHRSIPKGIHVYDLMAYEDKLFAALGSHGLKSAIAISNDNGKSWRTRPVGFYRLYTLFEFNNKLYAAGIFRTEERIKLIQKKMPDHKELIPYALFEYQQGQMKPVDVKLRDLFPRWKHQSAKLRKPGYFKQNLVYLGASPSNDHQYLNQQLYVMKSLGKSSRLALPDEANPQDIIIDDSRLLLLTTQELADRTGNKWQYKNTVYETTDLKQWKQLVHFEADTFTRSFEYMDGCFYFGMGSNAKETGKWWSKWELSPLTGSILKSTCIRRQLT